MGVMGGAVGPAGSLQMKVIRGAGYQAAPLSWKLKNMARWGWIKSWLAVTLIAPIARRFGLMTAIGKLSIILRHADGSMTDYGVVGRRVVTTAGVNFIVDAFTATATIENMNYHGIGSDNTAEAVGDTALVSEYTTQINPDSTRATGVQTQPSANVYQTAGTISLDGTVAVVEHGIFDQAATGGGTLLDRTVFAVINAVSGDSILATYQLTLTAGS